METFFWAKPQSLTLLHVRNSNGTVLETLFEHLCQIYAKKYTNRLDYWVEEDCLSKNIGRDAVLPIGTERPGEDALSSPGSPPMSMPEDSADRLSWKTLLVEFGGRLLDYSLLIDFPDILCW